MNMWILVVMALAHGGIVPIGKVESQQACIDGARMLLQKHSNELEHVWCVPAKDWKDGGQVLNSQNEVK